MAAPSPATVEQQIAQAAQQFLVEQASRDGLANPAAEAAVVKPGRTAPPCRQVTVTPINTRYPSRMRFAASCAGQDEWRQEFVVRGNVSAEVVVVAAAVPAGRAIAMNALALEQRDVSTIPDALSDPDEAAGFSARRPLRAGQVLQKRMLAAPILVKRGDTVQIVARNGVISVSAVGEALEAGQRDEVVRVRNASTGKIIRARITDNATVEPADLFTHTYSPD